MHRRALLAAVAAGVGGCTSTATDSGRTRPTRPVETGVVLRDPPGQPGATGTANDWVELRPDPAAIDRGGEVGGTGKPVGHSGSYPSIVYWSPPETVAVDTWLAVGSHGRSEYENAAGRIYLNRERVTELTAWLLAHERGHNLGLRHADGGVMDYASPDMPGVDLDTDLAAATATIVKHTDGLHVRSWDGDRKATVAALVAAWERGAITDADMAWVASEYRSAATGDVCWSDGALGESVAAGVAGDVAIATTGIYRYGNRRGAGVQAWA